MSRTYKAYTLWMKWRNVGWKPEFTITEGYPSAHSPIEIIEHLMASRYALGGYFIRGKTWMIKPEGQEPAERTRSQV